MNACQDGYQVIRGDNMKIITANPNEVVPFIHEREIQTKLFIAMLHHEHYGSYAGILTQLGNELIWMGGKASAEGYGPWNLNPYNNARNLLENLSALWNQFPSYYITIYKVECNMELEKLIETITNPEIKNGFRQYAQGRLAL